MTRAQVIEADWTWTGSAFESGVRVAVSDEGRIDAVGRLQREPTLRLPDRALLPGFVNTHSHAFQRGLRGRGERFPHGAGSFWTWREAMYELVGSLDAPTLRGLCLQAFTEMRDAGFTAVGEFHYLHHLGEDDFALDEVVLDAAAEAGIRLVLLETCYRTGGIGKPLGPGQRRFRTVSLERYWKQLDHLARQLGPDQSLGVAAHSVRAVPLDEIAELHAEACRRRLPFHMHVEEQRREIEESVAAFGRTPLAALAERFDPAGNFTAVHCTHSARDDLAAFLAAGGTVCVCPLTEGNLGDGLPALPPGRERRAYLSVGTDSNARIAALEEMRWLEYGQRLRREERGALANGSGAVAAVVLDAATRGGARALGLTAGSIAAGGWADFATVDLTAPALAGWAPDTLAESLVFGADNAAVTATCVAGRWRASG